MYDVKQHKWVESPMDLVPKTDGGRSWVVEYSNVKAFKIEDGQVKYVGSGGTDDLWKLARKSLVGEGGDVRKIVVDPSDPSKACVYYVDTRGHPQKKMISVSSGQQGRIH